MKRFAYKMTVFALLCVTLNGCLMTHDENQDWTETILLTVSSETGRYYTYPLEDNREGCEGMKIKEDHEEYWSTVPFTEITDFHYKVGNEYRLKVLKTHLANPPADGSNVRYKLIEVIRIMNRE